MREINESQTWRIFFADVNRVRGISWGYGSCLLEGLNQVSMYTSLSPTNYKYWSFSNRTGIISDEPFQSYTAEYSEKTMRWLPKVNTFGLGNEMIVNYAVEAKPRTERYSLGLLGVNQIVMEKPFTKLMIENLGLKNIKKVGEPFVAPLTSPVSKRFDGLWVAELSTTLPRAFIIKGMDLKNQHQLSSERAPKFDRETIEVSSKKYHYERVSISKYEPEYVRFDLNTSKDAQLVLLDLDHPFWRAKIDGKDAEITTAFKMFRTLTVPSGEHKIEFYCEIPYLKFWASFSIFCLLGIVLGCVANHLTAKKEPLEKSQAET